MPIPQLNKSRNFSYDRGWKNNKKKYYIPKRKNDLYGKHNFGNSLKEKFFSRFSKKNVVLFSASLVLAGGIFVLGLVAWVSKDLPDPNTLMNRRIAQTTKIYDRTGETVLYEIHGDEKRTLINLDEIPDYAKNATIAIEDKDFYKHGGFSLWAIFRTAVTDVLFRKSAGGSTLTQQFIKNAVLTNEKTFTRKIKELVLAYQTEKKFSKDQILQMYLNEIPYGSNAYGIEAASQKYFGKSARDITLAEAALLAALPQAPSRYSPYGPNRDLLIARQHYILDLMVEQDYTTEPKAEAAKQYKLEFKPQSTDIIAPHFVMYVKEVLAEKYGEKIVEQDGLKIYTTLDLYKQKIAEEIIVEKTEANKAKYNASNAALVSVDPKTGQILAMVGSKDYFSEEIDGQVNIATSKRQPGSSMKPIVYAASFIKGYTPDTILFDVNTNFSVDADNPYEPRNYGGGEHGPVTMRKALAGSLNIPAVKTIYLAGINNVLDLADEMGYTTLKDRSRFGLSLVLGGGEVKLLEHTNAYSAFAREGILPEISAILKVEDKDGKMLEEYHENTKKVFDAGIARMINSILSDNSARAYIFGGQNWLTLGDRPVAAKTGTTNDYRDAWTIGYTPSLVTGVWVGNNDNSQMKMGADGSVVAAPIWHDYMKKVLGDTPAENFNPSGKIATGKPVLDGEVGAPHMVKIDKATGLLATENTPPDMIEEKAFYEAHSILYYVDKDNPLGGQPSSPTRDPQFNLWESAVAGWIKKQKESPDAATSTPWFATSTPPTEFDNIHTPENKPTLEIISPADNDLVMTPLLNARVNASAPREINRAEYYINNNLLAIVTEHPFNLNRDISFLNNGYHNLRVKVCDDVSNCAEKSIEFNLILDNNTGGQNASPNLSWSSPANGVAAAAFDFPLKLKLKTSNPTQITKADIYYINESGEKTLIKTVQPIEGDYAEVDWSNVPPSGTYKLYAEYNTWGGQEKKTEEIFIVVNNAN